MSIENGKNPEMPNDKVILTEAVINQKRLELSPGEFLDFLKTYRHSIEKIAQEAGVDLNTLKHGV